MKYEEDSHFDELLNQVNQDIEWDKGRQANVRQNLTYKLEQNTSKKANNQWRHLLMPVTGVLMGLVVISMLLMSEVDVPIKQDDTSASPSMDQPASEQSDIIIDDKKKEKIRGIQSTGFTMAIPDYSPVDSTKLNNISYRREPSFDVVRATYTAESKELFAVSQEQFTDVIEDGNPLEDYTKLQIQGETVYFKEDKLNQLLYVTNQNSINISSHHLDKDKLIHILDSIKLSDFK